MDRFVPRDDMKREWIASRLAMTGEGAVSFFPVIASEARQSMDRFVPRDDMKREWIASYLGMTATRGGSLCTLQ
ncbi:hypothetical protein [Limnohabitans sp. Bal53]|uniref:hypothetical protein n=1 Tax=Limnohabitans sp. Bal53 TaxID=1977910 RepID=UPI000D3BDFF9|nr:hypothetical protein [Limnohabitans sp. Bal53]PUE41754.1 hypothetical protein B9Z50_08815 [Limnohabitans sp. Bal53]